METNVTAAEKGRIKHKCAICFYSTIVFQRYKKHLLTHSSERPFKCPKCPYRAKAKSYVKMHLKLVHMDQPRPFPCPESDCNYAAKDKYQLKMHSKAHSDEKSFVCSHPNCNFSTSRRTDFTVHLRIHTGEKPFVCQFESCSFAAAQKGNLVKHSRIHTKERPYKCPEPNCEYSSAEKGTLANHRLTHELESEESEERPLFRCPLCEYSGKNKGNFTTHVKRHSLEKLFVCSFESCEFRCKCKRGLNAHLKTHRDEKRYKCELCPFRGKTREVVTIHLKNVHSDPNFRPFKCTASECHFSSKSKSGLKRHLLTHNPEKKYACSFPDCDYRGIEKSLVRSHEHNFHNEEKKQKCPLCPFRCKIKSGLTLHLRTHTKETPYKCKENGCEYRGKSSTLLRRHKKSKHHNHFSKETK